MSIWKEWTTTSHAGTSQPLTRDSVLMYTIGMRWVMDVYMERVDHNQSRGNLTTTHSGLSINVYYWNEGVKDVYMAGICL